MRERQTLEQELHHLSAAAMSAEAEILHTPDQRVRETGTTAVPFRWICHLEMKAIDSSQVTASSTATGLLISPRHVLTAAHVLRSNDGRFGATHAWVYPGRDGNTKPFGRVESTTFRHHPNWFRNGAVDEDYDYGVIILDSPIGSSRFATLGNKPLGWWGDATHGASTRIQRLDPTTLDGRTINVAGYPADKTAGTLWRSTGPLTMMRTPQGQITTQARRMAHGADTHSSQSGAPLWMYEPSTGIRHLVGVHTGAVDVNKGSGATAQRLRLNVAIRITREVVTQIGAWT